MCHVFSPAGMYIKTITEDGKEVVIWSMMAK